MILVSMNCIAETYLPLAGCLYLLRRGMLSPAGGSGRAIYMTHRKYNCRETEGGSVKRDTL